MATGTIFLPAQNAKEYCEPRRVPGVEGVTAIACGSAHMLALRKDGLLWSWGANRYGQLGLGDTERRAAPAQIATLSGVTAIFAAGGMSAARVADGSWMVWGESAL